MSSRFENNAGAGAKPMGERRVSTSALASRPILYVGADPVCRVVCHRRRNVPYLPEYARSAGTRKPL